MGGCCTPGTLGPAASMVDAFSSGSKEIKSNGSSWRGDFFEPTTADEGPAGSGIAAFQELRAAAPESCSAPTVEERGTMVDVEKLLRVLEVAVESEYVDGWRGDSYHASNEDRESAGSMQSSLAESATSVYSLAESACSKNSSTGAGELCSLEKENWRSTSNNRHCDGKPSTCLDWAERVERALESMDHLQRQDPHSELKTSSTKQVVGENNLGNFGRILQQILTDTKEESVLSRASSPCRCQPDVLTEVDDYPRGSSDTNSEEAERDRKTVCLAPLMNSIFLTHQPRAKSFLSFGVIDCQPGEQQEILATYINDGSMRLDESDSNTDQVREFSHPIESCSSTVETTQAGAGGADESYANWLERHSKDLQGKTNAEYESMVFSSEHQTCTKGLGPCIDGESKAGPSELMLLQRQVNGFESDCSRSGTTQGDLAEFEYSIRDDERTSASNLKGGEPRRGNVQRVDDLETNCSTLTRGQGIREHALKFCSCRPVRCGQSSFKFTPDIQVDNNYCASLRSIQMQKPSSLFPGNSIKHLDECARADLSERAMTKLGRSCEAAITIAGPHQRTCRRSGSDYGGAKTHQNEQSLLETPSDESCGGCSRSLKRNCRAETPKSVFAGAGVLESNANHREKVKVCVRMRPFNDDEKVCPLRQLLCVMGEKVIVKEYDRQRDTDLLEFQVDCVLDDSYLQKFRAEKKNVSQIRMFESIGLPCLEYALDGYNTTVLACGQVGTGKTYTMMGDGTENGSGLMPRLAKELMNQLKTEFEGEFEVQVSYLEIYQDKIRDLLAVRQLELQDSRCGSMRSCAASYFDGSEGSTYENSVDYNATSHASFFVGTLRSWRNPLNPTSNPPAAYWDGASGAGLRQGESPPLLSPLSELSHQFWQYLWPALARHFPQMLELLSKGGRRFVNGCPSSSFSVINLVDLAGTEKPQSAKKTSLERLDESRYINRSIAQLNDVIVNLSRNKKFISYRGSTLTWLLRDSLGGGNSKLFLIAHISPAEQDFQESFNTLRYASKANRIHTIITSHPDHKKQLLVRMKREIRVLHNLVHDLSKNKISESSVNEEVRRISGHLPSQKCQGSSDPTGMNMKTTNLPEL